MSTVKSKNLQVGTDATASNNFTIYQPSTPDGTLRVGVGNADSPTEVGRFTSSGYVATNAPLFIASISADQSISSATWTKVQFDTEDVDTTSDFDPTTNYRWTPSVAGYYQINFSTRIQVTGGSAMYMAVYKNGAGLGADINSSFTFSTGALNHFNFSASGLIYMNGTTDYVEAYVWSNGTSPLVDKEGSSEIGKTSIFSGFLARAI